MNTRLSRASLSALLALAAAAAGAQTAAPAPSPTVGDVWKYRTVDRSTGREQSSFGLEFVGVEGDRLAFRTTGADAGRTAYFTRDLNPCRGLRGGDALVCTGALKFPMQVGDRHAYERLPWSSGEGHSSGDCRVAAHETVRVPAGAHDAFRIECSGRWTLAAGGIGGRVKETLWYAPAVHRLVKWELTTYQSSGGVDSRTRTELVEFVPKR